MELRVAPVDVWKRPYCVVYPSTTPAVGPKWMIYNSTGLVADAESLARLSDFVTEALLDALYAAAEAAVARGDGEPLEEQGEPLPARALEWLERLGWAAATNSAAAA